MRRALSLALIFMILASMSFTYATAGGKILEVSPNSKYKTTNSKYKTIQQAINAAESGDIVKVSAGTYKETIIVNKSITLIGAGPDKTIIDGGGSGPVMSITANGVTVKGFTIRNGISGIYLYKVERCNILRNVIENNQYGIYLMYSSNANISRNNVTKGNIGLYLKDSSNKRRLSRVVIKTPASSRPKKHRSLP